MNLGSLAITLNQKYFCE